MEQIDVLDPRFRIRQEACWGIAEMFDNTVVSNSFMYRLQLIREALEKGAKHVSEQQITWMFSQINHLIIENEQLRAKNSGLVVEILRARTERLNIGRDRLEIP